MTKTNIQSIYGRHIDLNYHFFLVFCRCAFSPWAPQHSREILPHGQNQLAAQYGRQQQSHNVLLRQRLVSHSTKCYICHWTKSWDYCLFVVLRIISVKKLRPDSFKMVLAICWKIINIFILLLCWLNCGMSLFMMQFKFYMEKENTSKWKLPAKTEFKDSI